MPRKSYEVKGVATTGALQLSVDGSVVGRLLVGVELSFGDWGSTKALDIYPLLTDSEKRFLQGMRDRIESIVQDYYLGGV